MENCQNIKFYNILESGPKSKYLRNLDHIFDEYIQLNVGKWGIGHSCYWYT